MHVLLLLRGKTAVCKKNSVAYLNDFCLVCKVECNLELVYEHFLLGHINSVLLPLKRNKRCIITGFCAKKGLSSGKIWGELYL